MARELITFNPLSAKLLSEKSAFPLIIRPNFWGKQDFLSKLPIENEEM